MKNYNIIFLDFRKFENAYIMLTENMKNNLKKGLVFVNN